MPKDPASCCFGDDACAGARRASKRSRRPGCAARAKGWVTAEYGMLPRSTGDAHAPRGDDRQADRPHAGDPAADRPLAARGLVDLVHLGEKQITIDCDVLRGRWRHAHRLRSPAAIIALWECDRVDEGPQHGQGPKVHTRPASPPSRCGIYRGKPVLDLDYLEDVGGRDRRQFRHDRLGQASSRSRAPPKASPSTKRRTRPR
jgi:ribonuclease PH